MNDQPLNGVILIDKPSSRTSQEVVTQVKKMLRVRKAGHTGTLDPFATGVLPVCLNEGTKLAPFLIDQDKEYEGGLVLGIETDTQDSTGQIINTQPVGDIPSDRIIAAFARFQGTIEQIPPMFSAVKHQGVRLYELAREGKSVERTSRQVMIFSIEILTIALPHISFRVHCSKGTYIRTLANDIGRVLGCGACLKSLRRTASGTFRLEQAITPDALREMPRWMVREKVLISPTEALSSFTRVTVNQRVEEKVKNGRDIYADEVRDCAAWAQEGHYIKIVNDKGVLLAVARILPRLADGKTQPLWKLLRVFNLEA